MSLLKTTPALKDLLICTALICLFVSSNAVFAADDLTLLDSSPDLGGCTIVNFTVHSKAMNRDIEALAVLPPGVGINDATKYPVLYALHGRGAPYKVYSHMSGLKRALKDQPMIVVSFNADKASWYVDSTEKPDSQFTTFFFDEFTPVVEKTFPISGVRGITGFSMGGYGALHFMLTRPDFFVNVSGMSTAVNFLISEDGRMDANVKELFGPGEGKKYLKQPKIQNLRILPRIKAAVEAGVKLPPIYEHCGTEDHQHINNQKLRDLLIELNAMIQKSLEAQVAGIADKSKRRKALVNLVRKERIDFTFVQSPGGHNWAFWAGNVADVLNFHYRGFVEAAKQAAAR